MKQHMAIEVLGVPAPQGSKTAVMNGGRARVIEGGSATGRAAHKAWRTAVAETAREAWADRPPIDGPCRVEVLFWMPRPASAPKWKVWADRKPDVDKLARNVLDALADAGVLRDDARVVDLWVVKLLTHTFTGARITVAEVDT